MYLCVKEFIISCFLGKFLKFKVDLCLNMEVGLYAYQRSVGFIHVRLGRQLDLETDLDTVASVTSNDPRLTFDPIK